ncbi:stage II sporulation protein B [Fictibacillus macauensis ZFHKF-1]|uniref:Stage II sporulation protein B n=1 Tax=Fictibacillus macauensis ZFHKF-1 TaxID=1196324 RepID=I8UEL0_9BACL|nr:SPOR domain-containing protein [Fictibacillus macauensis]EIT85345.1 stage II sporulation protein B [Fictibacillus macauensis ZFHKF-1]
MTTSNKVNVTINGKSVTHESHKAQDVSIEETAVTIYPSPNESFLSKKGSRKEPLFQTPQLHALFQKLQWKHRFQRKRMLLRNQHRNVRPFSKPMITAVIAAVFIGCTFGAVILMLFTGNSVSQHDQSIPTQAAQRSSAVTIKEIPLTLYGIQNGLFATKDKAEEARTDLQKKGVAAAIYKQGTSYAVLIGLSNQKDQAVALEQTYKKEGVSTWLRKVDASSSKLHVADRRDEAYMVNGKILLQNLITLSEMTAVSEKAQASISKDFKQWQAYRVKQEHLWSEGQRKAVAAYEKEVGATIAQLKTNKDSRVKQAALNSFIAYDSLMKALQ